MEGKHATEPWSCLAASAQVQLPTRRTEERNPQDIDRENPYFDSDSETRCGHASVVSNFAEVRVCELQGELPSRVQRDRYAARVNLDKKSTCLVFPGTSFFILCFYKYIMALVPTAVAPDLAIPILGVDRDYPWSTPSKDHSNKTFY